MNSNPSHDRLPDELLSAYLDGELPEREREQIEVRLDQDAGARRTLAELRKVSEAVRQLPRELIGTSLRDAVLARVNTEPRHSTETDDSSVESRSERNTLTWGRSPRGWLWASMTVAAALLVMIVQSRVTRESAVEVAHRDGDTRSSASSGATSVPELRNKPNATEPSAPADHLAVEPLAEEAEDLRRRHDESLPHAAATSAEAVLGQKIQSTGPEIAIDDSPFLVVHVTMPPDAREKRALENLLGSNSIEFEPPARSAGRTTAGELSSPEHLAQAKELPSQEDSTALSAAAVAPTASVATQPRGRARRATIGSERWARSPDTVESRAEGEDVEVIFVEAAPAEVALCLSAMQQDERNFLAVQVGEEPTQNLAIDDVQLDTHGANRSLTLNWRQYNRGQVPTDQRKISLPTGRSGYAFGEPQSLGFGGVNISDRNLNGAKWEAEAQSRLWRDSSPESNEPVQVLFVVGTQPSIRSPVEPPAVEKARVVTPSTDQY